LSSPERGVEDLVAGVQAGDDDAGAALVSAMTPLVAGLAKRFAGRVPRSDLEQAGMVGLLQAAQSFDPERGTPFGGYATPFVVGEMLSCVRQLAAPVKVPRSVAENQRAVAAAIEELTAQQGKSPTVPEIGAFADLDPDSVLEALRLRLAATAVTLDEVEEQRLGAADEAISRVEDRLDLGARLDRLDARSRRVIVMRFGLELSQREIAARLNISQMHVSRLMRAGLAQLATDDRPDQGRSTAAGSDATA
jgi:RNA polymerase sigma-B factor